MRILLTNDDGIYARGLAALYEELSREADCLIVAPEIEQSAVGHAITLFRPHQEADFTVAARFACRMVRLIEKNQSLHGSAFNVNIPCLPEEKIKGVAVVRQGRGNVIETFEKRTDPRDNIYYWISAEVLTAAKDLQTDIGALSDGYITITPIQYDLTRYDLLESLKTMMDKP
ncbi:MAG: hypothetical protein CVU51_12285 [Deltaproteobacteria bacterium HGW-Deltaproteobacteria-1]|nr:MAG: hypothetical protein CVU51_12285 [Deltaproteobacteria bacterium HGW-Deltaproteobacteria-1]